MLAAGALIDGKCDMIALGRQLLCDPYWVRKLEGGQMGEIVHCTYCTTCAKAKKRGEDLRCALNLNMYGEPIYKSRPVKSK